MTIGFSALFTDLGKLANVSLTYNVFHAIGLPTAVNSAVTELAGHPDVAAILPTSLITAQTVPGFLEDNQMAAENLLLKVVNADNPRPSSTSIQQALEELIRQMIANSQSVPICTVGATAAAVSGIVGTGQVVLSTKRADGRQADLTHVEVGNLTCTADAQGGTAVAAAEPWSFKGKYPAANPLFYDWPAGSGGSQALTTIDSQLDNSGNLLTNSGFETFTVANTPDKWTLVTGTAGTHFFSEASVFHRGTKSLRLAGDGSSQHKLRQTFDDTTNGTTGKLLPTTAYAVALWIQKTSPMSGVTLNLKLVDGSNATVNDDQGTANAFTFDVGGVAEDAWVTVSGTFRTPKLLPSTLKLEISISGTAITNLENVYLDSLALGRHTALYTGGPLAAMFAGATSWKLADRYTITTTNNYAGTTLAYTWQWVFNRWYGMRALDLLLPTHASPTLADSLIA